MNTEATIDKYYKESVNGLDESLMANSVSWYKYVVNLPIHLQVVYTIIVFNQQVFNGGLHQYFFNSYGQFAYLTLDHLILIKAYKTAEILKRALSEVNSEQLGIGEFRNKVFNRELDRIANFDEELSDFLDELDDQYYSLDENSEQLLVDYLDRVDSEK
jgi:hypothetical protein